MYVKIFSRVSSYLSKCHFHETAEFAPAYTTLSIHQALDCVDTLCKLAYSSIDLTSLQRLHRIYTYSPMLHG